MAFTSLACFHGRMTSWFNSLPCVSCSPRIKPWFNSFLHSEACCLGFVFSEVLNHGLIPPHCSAAVAAAPVWRGQPWNRNLFQFSTGEVEVGSRRTGSLVRSLKGMPIWLCGKMPLGGSKPRRSWTIPYQNPQARALWPSSRNARSRMVEKCSKGVFKGSLHKSLVQVFKGLLDTRFLLRDLGTEVFCRCFQGTRYRGPSAAFLSLWKF